MRTWENQMAEFKLDAEKGTLKVAGKLFVDEETELRRCCDEILRGPSWDLTVDLKKVSAISSMSVGIIAALWLDAVTLERNLKVSPSKEVRRIFTLAGFDRVFKLDPED